MPRSVAQKASDGWSRNITESLQRRHGDPLRAPATERSNATVGMKVPSLFTEDDGQCGCGRRWATRTQPAFRRRGGGDIQRVHGQSGGRSLAREAHDITVTPGSSWWTGDWRMGRMSDEGADNKAARAKGPWANVGSEKAKACVSCPLREGLLPRQEKGR